MGTFYTNGLPGLNSEEYPQGLQGNEQIPMDTTSTNSSEAATISVTTQQLKDWIGSGGGSLTVTDGTTSVANVTEVSFTSGATVTSGGTGIADVAISGGGSVSPANPTATASDTAVNGTATTYMRSDAAPAVQKASATQFGLVKPDNVTITFNGSGLLQASATGNWVAPISITKTGKPTYTLDYHSTYMTGELMFSVTNDNGNVMSFENLSTVNSFSCIDFIGSDGTQHCAVGYGNPSTGAPFTSAAWLESSNFNGTLPVVGNPPNLGLIQTGTLGGGASASYWRMQCIGATGEIAFYNNDGATKRLSMLDAGNTLQTSGANGNTMLASGTAGNFIQNNAAGSQTVQFKNLNNSGFTTANWYNDAGTNFLTIAHANSGAGSLPGETYIMGYNSNVNFRNYTGSTFVLCGFVDCVNGYMGLGPKAPATSADAGTAGDIAYDANYIYICTAANTWKRVALTAF